MAEEEEVLIEVEAVQAVYGEDCLVIQDYPPHFNVVITPRTANDSSQQFVEVVLGIQSGPEYPTIPPHIDIVESKGLDEDRRTHLVTSIQNKAVELSSCLMLVALCEEAVEILSNMNHPEGNCPLCLYPLVAEEVSGSLPFMKLMSCYHCFHSECIIRWWKWLQELSEANEKNQADASVAVSIQNQRGMCTIGNRRHGNCPVCRKVFDVKDIEHVLEFLGTDSSQLSFATMERDEDEIVMVQSDVENNRREKFEALLKLQQENSGLIEPRKDIVILPGMFLPEPAMPPTASIETGEKQCEDSACNPTLEMDSSSSLNKATTSKQRNSSTRKKNRGHYSRRGMNAQPSRKQWIKREMDTSDQQ